MDINALMRQAQNMQKQMKKKQKEVEDKEFVVNSNGGAIIVTIMGDKTIKNIEIDQDLIEKDNKEMLQEMLTIALNEAINKVVTYDFKQVPVSMVAESSVEYGTKKD